MFFCCNICADIFETMANKVKESTGWVLFLGFPLSFIASGNAISKALTSDRVVDAGGMTLALASYSIVQLPPTGKLTYGYHRFESLSSVLLSVVRFQGWHLSLTSR